jgi:Helix-turn-helix domain
MVPGWLLARQPSGNAVLMYAALARYGRFNTHAGTYEECRPALSTLQEDTGLSESTVKRALAELVTLGAIRRRLRFAEDGRTPLPTAYTVLFGALNPPADDDQPTTEPPPDPDPPGSTREPTLGPPVTGDLEPNTQTALALALVEEPSGSVGGGFPARARARGRAQATRIPENFPNMITRELVEWARRECPHVDGRTETAKFVDYWQAASGQRARKHDWVAAWRVWMRNAQDDRGRVRRNTGPNGQPVNKRDATIARLREQAAALDLAEPLRVTSMRVDAGAPQLAFGSGA